MKQYLLIALVTVFLINLSLLVAADVRDALRPAHITLPDGQNMTPEINASLKEMRGDDTFAYEAFVGWQAWAQNGEYINISADGIRHTPGQPEKFDQQVLLFGGSTMWGWGVGDGNTIPAHLQSLLPDQRVVNLGEISYNATQEFNRLLLHMTKHPEVRGSVIFFDGVNEMLSSCSGVNGAYGHAMVEEIKRAITVKRRGRLIGLLDDLFLTQTRRLADIVKGRFNSEPLSRCAIDEAYAEHVARRLVTSWEAAAAFARAKGLGFFAVLQPTPYTDSAVAPRWVNDEWRDGIRAIYPRIVELAKGQPWFVDGRNWFNGSDPYVDACCHINGADNALLARQLGNLLRHQ
jgi:hypothetical protein